ncbi:MAG: flagellar assembly protein FliW [SAR324 cluster bacterium]|nr:flagellar assembly protein FliW [SAR324 cluster bacterium]
MKIQTSRFGEIEVEENQIITMPSGLIGFSENRHFVIREDEAASPFRWLQSTDSNGLAFVMIEPHVSVSNYELELSREHLNKLKAESIEELKAYVLVTMAKKMEDVTVNLQGPLLFNLEKRLGLQFIIADNKYSTRHSLFGDKLTKDTSKSSAKTAPAEVQQAVSEKV